MIGRISLLFILCGCMGEDQTLTESHQLKQEEWVCHNPDSEYHGAICSDECYWVGFQRVPGAFCWFLKKEDCEGELHLNWQKENCHLLEK